MKKNLIYVILIIYIVITILLKTLGLKLDFPYIIDPLFYFFISIFIYKETKNSRKRISKYKLQTTFIVTSFFIIFYLLLGLFIGYSKNIYSLETKTLIKNFRYFILLPIFIEILRNYLSDRKSNAKKIILSFIFTLIYIDVVNIFYFSSSKIEIHRKVLEYLIPGFFNNLLLTFLTIKIGVLGPILLIIPINIMFMLSPILPKTDWFLELIIKLLFYFILYRLIKGIEKKYEVRKKIRDNTNFLYFPTITVFLLLILFIAGFFNYRPVAILSDSMVPIFRRGDMVIVKKSKIYEIGDIIQYKRDKALVIHRIVSIDKKNNGDIIYTTKGDNNKHIDNKTVNQKDVLGIVKISIPKLGYPTIFIYELIDKEIIENQRGEINNE